LRSDFGSTARLLSGLEFGNRPGRWGFIYISTIGDTITPEGLKALALCIQKNQADVVFFTLAFSLATGTNLKSSGHWPVFKFAPILKRYAGGRLTKKKAALIRILSGASGLLGSCASCLFRV
jgi:hypothetical protein